ncbi:MAG: hypothetical protein ACJA2S_005558 [Cyclobacteriaceae bacterium]|jgi:hypothetical protein
MTKYTFSNPQRFAIYVTHGEKCYLCNEPIDLKSMHVDHVIPESLLENKINLEKVLIDFGFPSTFDLNSYENWMPSCAPCNLKKLSEVFNPSPIIQIVLQKAIKKADSARELADKTVSKIAITKALSVLQKAEENGTLSDDIKSELAPLVEYQINERNSELVDQPIRLTPLYEVISESGGIKMIKGRYGIGGRPSGNAVHLSFDCPNCGSSGAWNGARCVVCGEMNDD